MSPIPCSRAAQRQTKGEQKAETTTHSQTFRSLLERLESLCKEQSEIFPLIYDKKTAMARIIHQSSLGSQQSNLEACAQPIISVKGLADFCIVVAGAGPYDLPLPKLLIPVVGRREYLMESCRINLSRIESTSPSAQEQRRRSSLEGETQEALTTCTAVAVAASSRASVGNLWTFSSLLERH